MSLIETLPPPAPSSEVLVTAARSILLWLVQRKTGERVPFGQCDDAVPDGPHAVVFTWVRTAPGTLPRGWRRLLWLVRPPTPTWDSEAIDYITPWTGYRADRPLAPVKIYPEDTLTIRLRLSE